MSILSRAFAGPSDVMLLVDWLRTVRRHERLTDYPSIFDLPGDLSPVVCCRRRVARLCVRGCVPNASV